jgi:hypothetical protein
VRMAQLVWKRYTAVMNLFTSMIRVIRVTEHVEIDWIRTDCVTAIWIIAYSVTEIRITSDLC